jgi:acyl carrier protein
MAKMNNLEELENLLTDVLNCSKADLKDENGPNKISNWDSITHMEMISKIEDKFSIQLDVDEINQIDTIGSIKNVLKKHGLKI